jgi:hypothetical protein
VTSFSPCIATTLRLRTNDWSRDTVIASPRGPVSVTAGASPTPSTANAALGSPDRSE